MISYLREELEPELGRSLGIDILSGTSVGAINACHMASLASHPKLQGHDLTERWRALELDHVLRWGAGDMVRVLRDLVGKPSPGVPVRARGGLINPAGLERLVLTGAHWPSIGRSIRTGALQALAVSATHVASGRTVIFIQRRGGGIPKWTRDPHLTAVASAIGPRHALASAAIPVLFPAVRLHGRLYVDGGLRFETPSSPAIRLGAERVAIISLRYATPPVEPGIEPPAVNAVERTYASAPFLVGKTLNAFLLDRTEQDVERLRRINSILVAGTEAFGPTFRDVLNGALVPHRNSPVRYLRTLLQRPSQDIGRLAATYARSPEFKKRSKGLAGSTIRRLVEREAPESADLVSYLLFDGGFADLLIELGRNDAKARRDEWIRFWSDAPESPAEEAQFAARSG